MSVRLGIDKMLPRQKPPDEILIVVGAADAPASMMMDDELEVDETSTINARINKGGAAPADAPHAGVVQEGVRSAGRRRQQCAAALARQRRRARRESDRARCVDARGRRERGGDRLPDGLGPDAPPTTAARAAINTLCLVVHDRGRRQAFAFRAATFSDCGTTSTS